MRKLSLLTLACAATMLFAACTKDTDNPSSTVTTTTANSISTSDVTEAVTEAVSGSTSGMVTQNQMSATLASVSQLPCGGSMDTAILLASPQGALISFNVNLDFIRTCICNGSMPSQYNTTITGTSSYSAILMSAVDSTSAQVTITGLQDTAANYMLNENYTRKGTIQSLIGNEHSFTSSLTFNSTNISIAKSTNKIVSGTATALFTGTTSTGNSSSHTATITFLGNNHATLVVDNGTPSGISW